MGRDDQFKDRDSNAVLKGAVFCLEHLDDFVVLILFSVFESIVRERVRAEVQREQGRLTHPLVAKIAKKAPEEIEEGPFFHILEIFKGQDVVDFVEHVNQVRKYRNWVAHGRRANRPSAVTPLMAYDRLKRFLGILNEPNAS